MEAVSPFEYIAVAICIVGLLASRIVDKRD